MSTTVKKITLALFIGCILPFALLEGVVRVAKPHWDLMEMTGRTFGEAVPHPMATWAQVDAFCALRPKVGFHEKIGKTVNGHGFMSTPELEVEKPEGTIRIAFFGGSSTAGTGWPDLADEETWPYKTAQILQSNRPNERIEFINAGVTGYSTFESLGRLQARVRFFDPDAIVVYHSWNDMYYWNTGTVTNMHRWRVQEDNGWSFDKTTRPQPYVLPRPIDPFLSWSQLLVRLRLRVWPPVKAEYASGENEQELLGHYDPRGPELFRENLGLIRQSAKTLEMELFVTKQATLIAPGISEEARELCGYFLHGFDHDAHLRAFADAYQIIDEEFSEEQIIDVSHLSGREDLFGDHIHPKPAGATAIAQGVAAHLLQHMDALQ